MGLVSPLEEENSRTLQSWGLSTEWLPQARRWHLLCGSARKTGGLRPGQGELQFQPLL